MGKIKGSKRYGVKEVASDNPTPPPAKIIEYVVFDRLANKALAPTYESYEAATEVCNQLNGLEYRP